MFRTLSLGFALFSTTALADIAEERGEKMLQPGETLTVAAQCPPGLMVTGGGYVIETFERGQVLVIASLPAPNQSWSTAILATQPQSEGSKHVRLMVTAVCLKL